MDEYGKVLLNGAAEKVVSVDEWTQFVVKMQIPEDAETFILRIIEQGDPAKWGGEPGILGDYAIAGVQMEECEPFLGYVHRGDYYDPRTTGFSVGYTMDDVVLDWASATVEETEDGLLNLNFNNLYDEARFKLPRSYSAEEIINFKVYIFKEVIFNY